MQDSTGTIECKANITLGLARVEEATNNALQRTWGDIEDRPSYVTKT